MEKKSAPDRVFEIKESELAKCIETAGQVLTSHILYMNRVSAEGKIQDPYLVGKTVEIILHSMKVRLIGEDRGWEDWKDFVEEP